MVHHVCGSHEWAGGRCEHAEEDAKGEKKYLDPESPAAEALRAIVFDTRWLKSLDYYIHNRHTGQLEVHTCTFNMLLMAFILVFTGFTQPNDNICTKTHWLQT